MSNSTNQLFSELETLKILLIDDDEWIRDSLHLFFENEGCQIVTFETAEEALDLLKTSLFDIIIIDYMLPGMNGLEFLKRIRESSPITMKILITAYGSRKILSDAIRIGIQDYIEKPFTTSAIERSLERLISTRGKNYQHYFAGINGQGKKIWRTEPRNN